MRQIIIDCDPGQDDAVALLLALASPEELTVLGITSVAGNVPLALTERNARIMCDLAGRTDVRVFAGCDKPMRRELRTAEYVHGATGIDGIEVFDPVTPLQEQSAIDFIVETLLAAAPDSITLVPTGPLTNIATAIAGIRRSAWPDSTAMRWRRSAMTLVAPARASTCVSEPVGSTTVTSTATAAGSSETARCSGRTP
jgi:inosine-uridine nucleoside N-ribohydrolase